jgi:ubiquinone/menaquinone biosynthesis C-methylase UbiE
LLDGKGKFVGVDISKGMIEKAKSNATGIPNVEFYEASADDLPFDNDYFDTVICSNSFHHYLHPEEALKEVKRVLEPNGRIHILDVTADDFFIRWIDKRVGAREREHVKFYSTMEYASMFSRVGLKHIMSSRVKMLYPLKVHVGGKES